MATDTTKAKLSDVTQGHQGEIDSIRKDLESLRQNVTTLTKSVGRDISDSARTHAQQARSAAEDGYHKAEDTVRRHPATSVAAAFAAGLAISALLKGRR